MEHSEILGVAEADMKRTKLFQSLRLALGGAALGMAVASIVASLLGYHGNIPELVGGSVGGIGTFAFFAKALHIFG